MKAGRTFAAYRYFLIPSEQISIYDTAKEKRREAVEKFFYRAINEKKVSFDIDDRKQVLAFEREITNTVLLFKFGCEKHETKYRESETGIESVVEANLPFVYLIFDIERQLLLLEVNTSVFKNVMQGQNKIQKWFEQAFFQYGFEIIFEEIIDENTFWKYVEDGPPKTPQTKTVELNYKGYYQYIIPGKVYTTINVRLDGTTLKLIYIA